MKHMHCLRKLFILIIYVQGCAKYFGGQRDKFYIKFPVNTLTN